MFHNTLLKEIQNIMKSIEIKFTRNAKMYETLDIRKESDVFISAKLKRDSFITYPQFDVEAIEGAGVLDLELIKLYREDKNNIPFELRQKVIDKQRDIIIRDYVEKNNYYRQLNGQPDYGDTDFLYVDLEVAEKYNIDTETPIHLLPYEKLNTLNLIGYIDQLFKKNPNKKYLNYLGYNSIDLVDARIANNFAIIRIDTTTHEALYKEFITLYEQSREYFMSVIYITEYSSQYDLYDNFIGLCIMLMTIQRLVVSMFKATIEHDFIDWGSIQMVFRAYNIPFIENLPMEYQRILLKNINILLRHKSTDKVLFDVCSLLGYERLKIFKYFLMKKHKLDEHENPLFFYKTVTDEFGARRVVEDKEKMYDLYFQKVAIDERNLALALTDVKNRVSYDEVVINDPYWWEDEGVKEKILEEEFTYVETKYLSINMIHKMTEMIFELMYAFRLIFDKKDEIEDIYVEIPRIVYNGKFKLFHIVTFLCALMCKRAKFKGNIITTHSKILGVYGFDFKENFDKIKEIVYANSKYVDPEILKYLENLTIIKPEDVNRVFNVIKDFNDYIVQKMYESKNIKQYHLYKQIFQTLMISEASKEMFKKSDGTEATTFLEYLEDQEYVLYEVVKETEIEFIPMLIEHILVKLNELMQDLKYLYILNDTSNPVFDAIVALLTFFKSYTVDITSLNIVYLFDSKYYNAIKLIGDLNTFLVEMDMDEEIRLRYADQLNRIGVRIENKEILILKEFFEFFSNILLPPDVLFLGDEINHLSKNLRSDELLSLKEKIEMSVKIEYIILVLMMRERLYLSANIRFDEDLKLYEEFNMEVLFKIVDDIKQTYSDSIFHIDTLINRIEEKIKMDEKTHMDSYISLTTVFELLDWIKMEKELELTSVYEKLEDKIKEVLVKMLIQSVYEKLEDTISIIANIMEKDKLELEEVYYIENTLKALELFSKNYSDNINIISTKLKIKNENILKDIVVSFNSKIPLLSTLNLIDRIDVTQNMELCTVFLTDFKEKINVLKTIEYTDISKLEELITVISKIIEKDSLSYNDYLSIKYNLDMVDKMKIKYSDNVEFQSLMKSDTSIKLKDFSTLLSKIFERDSLIYNDILSLSQNFKIEEADIDYSENIRLQMAMKLESVMKIEDVLSILSKIFKKDILKYNDNLSIKYNLDMIDKMKLKYSDNITSKSLMESNSTMKLKDVSTNYITIPAISVWEMTDNVNIKQNISLINTDLVNMKNILQDIVSHINFTDNDLLLIDSLSYMIKTNIKDKFKIVDSMSLDKHLQNLDTLSLKIEIDKFKKELNIKNNIEFYDKVKVIQNNNQKDMLKFLEGVNIENMLSMVERINNVFSDNISMEKVSYGLSDHELEFLDNVLIFIKHILTSSMSLNDDVRTIITNMPVDTNLLLLEKNNIKKDMSVQDKMNTLKDTLKDFKFIQYGLDKFSINSSISSSTKYMSINDTINILFSDVIAFKNKIQKEDSLCYKDSINIIYES